MVPPTLVVEGGSNALRGEEVLQPFGEGHVDLCGILNLIGVVGKAAIVVVPKERREDMEGRKKGRGGEHFRAWI